MMPSALQYTGYPIYLLGFYSSWYKWLIKLLGLVEMMTITSIAFTKLFADSNQVKEGKAIKTKTIISALVQ